MDRLVRDEGTRAQLVFYLRREYFVLWNSFPVSPLLLLSSFNERRWEDQLCDIITPRRQPDDANQIKMKRAR